MAFQECLLIFDKAGTRMGWPVDAWEELQFLQKLHTVRMAMGQATEALGKRLYGRFPESKVVFCAWQ